MGTVTAERLPLIWIVDDSPTQAALTQRTLGDAYRSEIMADGESLIEKLSSSNVPPDLILLDWVMPGMSGDEVCRFIRADPRTRDLPIVIMTASRTDSDSVVIGLDSGANDYLAKPVVPSELRARIGSILRAETTKRLAARQRHRLEGIVRFGRALYAEGADIPAVMSALADALVPDLCDSCAVVVRTAQVTHAPVVRHHADSSAAATTFPIPIRGVAEGHVTVTRHPRDASDDDRVAIEACLDLAGLAIEATMRSLAEKATTRFHEEMVGIVSHDLRTPLGALTMGIEILQEDATPAASKVLGSMNRSARRMTAIVDELLDVTRVRLGNGIAVTRAPIQLRSLVEGVLEELRLAHRSATIDLVGPASSGLWDAERLGQVIANLVSNAAKYGRQQRPITVTLSSRDDQQVISVHNQNRGAPIPPAQLALLFDPFERGEARTEQGLGLGLYIVREIVRAHGGTVVAESDDAGTTFRATLPCA
jgi:signal transduction histidine kinase